MRPGSYVAYAAHASDHASLGLDIAPAPTPSAFETLRAAAAACNTLARCVGLKYSPGAGDAPWRLFTGVQHDAIDGHPRVLGAALNPWLPPPS